MNRMRVGLSGCGRRGAEALAAVQAHGGCTITALHDPDAAALERLGAAAGIAARFADFEQLLATGIDFVVLTGPVAPRITQVEAAAAQGVHCCVHAPMAEDGDAARAMLQACERAGVRLGVAVAAQADPVLEQLRRMVADDWLGAPVLVQAMTADDRALRHPPGDGHWLRQGDAASPLLHWGLEALHLATWLTERPATAACGLAAHGLTRLASDSAAAVVQLRSGVLCTFASSHVCRGSSFSLHGTDGAIRIAEDRIWLRGRKRFRGDAFDYPEAGVEMALPQTGRDGPLAAHFELHGRFARWIDDRDDFPCPGEQAASDMAAWDAVRRAIERGANQELAP